MTLFALSSRQKRRLVNWTNFNSRDPSQPNKINVLEVMQVSIWPVTIPFRDNPRATTFLCQNPCPGNSFSVQNSGHRVKKTKQNLNPRAQFVQFECFDINEKGTYFCKSSFFANFPSLSVWQFFYRENKVFASLYTTVKINTAVTPYCNSLKKDRKSWSLRKGKVFFSDHADMYYAHLSGVFRRLNRFRGNFYKMR